jgi:hypothetical protein
MIYKLEAMILEHGKPVSQTVTLEKRVAFLPSKGMLLNCHQLASAVIGLVYTLDGNTFVAQLENVLQPTSGDTLKYMLDNGWEYKDLSLLNSTQADERSATQQAPDQGTTVGQQISLSELALQAAIRQRDEARAEVERLKGREALLKELVMTVDSLVETMDFRFENGIGWKARKHRDNAVNLLKQLSKPSSNA